LKNLKEWSWPERVLQNSSVDSFLNYNNKIDLFRLLMQNPKISFKQKLELVLVKYQWNPNTGTDFIVLLFYIKST
jgi:hypothetical protein